MRLSGSESGSKIMRGQKVWSNHRWGEVVESNNGTLTVQFDTLSAAPHWSQAIDSSAEYQALWGQAAVQEAAHGIQSASKTH
jgi:hypothetical protein